ncbi:MAG: phosphatase PAP2-related protein [Candidatus Zambryskibacteria bacterium]
MEQIKTRYRNYFKDKNFLLSLLVSFLILALALVANYYAGIYVTEKASNPVTDIILDNIRVFDVDAVFIYGPLFVWFLVILILTVHPQRIPFLVKSTGLFYLIRSLFISLTHIGPFPSHIAIQSTGLFGYLGSGADLFFSGHTGFPFLLALIFWENKFFRVLFIISSIVFGIVVLLGHLHYSIDVLSAFFITYGIYHIALRIFRKDITQWNSK